MKHPVADFNRVPRPTRLGYSSARVLESGTYPAHRDNPSDIPTFVPAKPRLALAVPIWIEIHPEHVPGREESTTGTLLLIPAGVEIPWDTPPNELRAQLVLAHFSGSHPQTVARWAQQLVELDTGS